MENIVFGIRQDDSLRNIIVEREDCYINSAGELCVADEDGDYESVATILRDSELAFNGQFYGIEPEIKLVSHVQIADTILHIKSEQRVQINETQADNTEAKKRLQRLLETSLEKRASDIHLRLNYENNTTQINGRIDGEFIELLGDQDLNFGSTVCHYAAVTLGSQQSFSEVTQVECTFLLETKTQQVDSEGVKKHINKATKWRMSQIQIDEGTKVTIRALETGTANKLPELGELGLTKGHVNAFVSAVNCAQGAIMMSGPTGSGKTTTINCSLQTIKSTRYVHSLEDPVEFNRPGRNHFATHVNEKFEDPKTKQKTKSFENYGKVLLRHDTDVLYFGEVRGKGAAEQFMRLATTGQVMVGTIHCNNSLSIITTIAEQFGVPVTQLAAPGILRALAHQRLVRKLCPSCKIPHKKAIALSKSDNDKELRKIIELNETIAHQVGRNVEDVCYRNTNSTCTACGGTGEKGRTALFEIIVVDDKAREFIRDLKLNDWYEHLKTLNWPSIEDHAKAKILAGLVDYRSVTEQVDSLVMEDPKDIYADMHMVME